jgi:RNA polymerase sigma factor (sigma-70 family)
VHAVPPQPLNRLVGRLRQALDADALGSATDGDLLDHFRRHRDPAAFEMIVRRHGARVIAACRRVLADAADADDSFQATFLVLMRDPGSVRSGKTLGAWLAGVAHRIALKAVTRRRRREQVESRVAPTASNGPDLSWREACGILHEELDRLPERQRLPLLLCYLEGLSRDEAATRLGRSLNAVKKSLEAGRAALKKRLTRRGITLSAGLLAAVSEPADGQSSLPPLEPVFADTIRPTVAALARSMRMQSHFKIAAVALAGSVLVAGLALGFSGGPKAQPPKDADTPAKPVAKADAPKDDGPKGERIAFSGRVVDPAGKPVKGAKVFLSGYLEHAWGPLVLNQVLATSEANGRFQFDLARGEYIGFLQRHLTELAATIEGYGLGFTEVPAGGLLNAEIRLVRDEPIRGEIRDVQGKPVVGARIRLRALFVPDRDDLTTSVQKLREVGWIRFQRDVRWMNRPEDREQVFARRIGENDLSIPGIPDVRTGTDGSFAFSGIGKSRLATLSVSHPDIATGSIALLTESGKTLQIPTYKEDPEKQSITIHRDGLQFTALPTQRFEGTVTDRDTGKPIPGLTVRSSIADIGDRGERTVHVQATTDKNGFYRLAGLPSGVQYLEAVPGQDMPYFPLFRDGGRELNHDPVRLDFALKRAQWIAGRVIDERTKEPVPHAHIHYHPAGGNDSVDDYFTREPGRPRMGFEVSGDAWTDREGRFRIAAVPGPGWLAVSNSDQPYVPATERKLQGEETNRLTPSGLDLPSDEKWKAGTDGYRAVAAVKPGRDQPAEYTITVDRGISVSIRTMDTAGKPLTGVICLPRGSTRDKWSKPELTPPAEFRTVNPQCPPPLILFQPERSLGILYQPKVGDAGPWNIKLLPTATVTGILIRTDGKPFRNVPLQLSYKYPGRSSSREWMSRDLPDNNVKTDEDGRFTVHHLIGDVEYEFYPILSDKPGSVISEFARFSAKAGEKKDLGSIKTKPPEE